MYWADEENIILDSGRKAYVKRGVIGLNMAGSVLHMGGRPMLPTPQFAGAPLELTVAEKLDVARYQVRSWQSFVAALEKAASAQPGAGESSGEQVSTKAPLIPEAAPAKAFGSKAEDLFARQ